MKDKNILINEMLKTYNHVSEDKKKQISEEIVGEKFRQIIIKKGIALDYALLHEDDFKFEENGRGVSGMIYILKDDNGIWNVWEAVYESGVFDNIRSFDNQIDAYIDAAKRRGFILKLEDFNYDINNTDDMLNIIEGAEDFLLAGINCYEGHSAKLEARYALLKSFEKQLYLKDGSKKLSRKKGNK